jgi:hypothetical protein
LYLKKYMSRQKRVAATFVIVIGIIS